MARSRDKLVKQIKEIVRRYSRAGVEQVRQQWTMYDDAEGMSEIEYNVEEAAAIVVSSIVAAGQKAWLLEYGKGSRMVKDPDENPFLEEYLDGTVMGADGEPLFNPARLREGMAVVGRARSVYLDLDGGIHISTGSREGVNLETMPRSAGGVEPLEPRYVIRKILFGEDGESGIIGDVNREIQAAMMKLAVETLIKFPKKLRVSVGR